jgi:hypothetical protein
LICPSNPTFPTRKVGFVVTGLLACLRTVNLGFDTQYKCVNFDTSKSKENIKIRKSTPFGDKSLSIGVVF